MSVCCWWVVYRVEETSAEVRLKVPSLSPSSKYFIQGMQRNDQNKLRVFTTGSVCSSIWTSRTYNLSGIDHLVCKFLLFGSVCSSIWMLRTYNPTGIDHLVCKLLFLLYHSGDAVGSCNEEFTPFGFLGLQEACG